jgi:hypothetical protein
MKNLVCYKVCYLAICVSCASFKLREETKSGQYAAGHGIDYSQDPLLYHWQAMYLWTAEIKLETVSAFYSI